MATTEHPVAFALEEVGSYSGKEANISSSLVNDSSQDDTFLAEPGEMAIWYNGLLVGGYVLIIVIGITANSAVLAIIMIDQFRHRANSAVTTINTYITNLASADLLFIFGGIFWAWINYNKGGWRFGELGCRIIIGSDIITLHASAYILIVMTIERFLAIMYPMTSMRFRNLGFARKVSTVIWLSACGLAMPVLVGMRLETITRQGKEKELCTFVLGLQAFNKYLTTVCVITFIIPSVLMIAVYIRMFAYIFGTIRYSANSDTPITKQLKSSSRRAGMIVFLIVTVWLLCFLPFWVNHFLNVYAVKKVFPDKARMFNLCTLLLSYLNSMVNPFLYTLMPKRYNVWRLKCKPPAVPDNEEIYC